MSEENKVIKVAIKSVYGKEMIYPRDEQAKVFAEIAGHKTLTSADIALIKKLGFTIWVIPSDPQTL